MLLKSYSSKQVSTLEGLEKFVRRFVEAVRVLVEEDLGVT